MASAVSRNASASFRSCLTSAAPALKASATKQRSKNLYMGKRLGDGAASGLGADCPGRERGSDDHRGARERVEREREVDEQRIAGRASRRRRHLQAGEE